MAEVSHSFYSQLQKVTGTENSNALVSATESTQQPTVSILNVLPYP